MKYPYFNQEKAAKDSYNYQYSFYDSKKFLRAYLKNRNSSLNYLVSNLNQGSQYLISEKTDKILQVCLSELNKEIESYKNFKLLKIEYRDQKYLNQIRDKYSLKKISQKLGQKKIKTKIILGYLIFYNLINQNQNKFLCVEKILKKYEVTKKIFDYYTSNLNKKIGVKCSFDNYICLYILLLISYKKTNNSQFLSTILKLSDYIFSENNRKKLLKYNKEILSIAILLELNFINKILMIKKIKL